MTVKQQAMRDMTEAGVSPEYLVREAAILALTRTEQSERVDFRKFNGGHNKKYTNQHENRQRIPVGTR